MFFPKDNPEGRLLEFAMEHFFLHRDGLIKLYKLGSFAMATFRSMLSCSIDY